jgi:serine/threonine-protein kinase
MKIVGPETLIAGRYELVAPMARGALAEVWRGTDRQLRRPVAVKVVHAELAANPAFRAAFGTEARAWAALGHSGAAWVFDVGEEATGSGSPCVFLVMELVEGAGLGDVLAGTGPLAPAVALDVLAQAASTLRAAHGRGLVHGNVKPANLLLRGDGVLKVTDFGVARAVAALSLADAQVELTSTPYRSPEQVAGQPATVASDIYSLGIVAYQCLAGTLPFAADGPVGAAVEHLTEAPQPLPSSVPDEVAALVAEMLDKDPARRPLDAGALALRAVSVCRSLGRRTTRTARELLGGDVSRLV